MAAIRPADADDLVAIHRIHRSAALGPDSMHRDDSGVKKWLSGRTPDSYRAEMDSCDFVVAEENSVVVGFGAIDIGNGEITSVYVEPAFTRKGIGRAIVGTLEQTARRAGLGSVTLQAAGGALDFYEKIGYSYVSPPQSRPRWAEMKKQL